MRIKFEKSGATKESVLNKEGDFVTCNKFDKESCEIANCAKLKIWFFSLEKSKLRKECAENIKKNML